MSTLPTENMIIDESIIPFVTQIQESILNLNRTAYTRQNQVEEFVKADIDNYIELFINFMIEQEGLINCIYKTVTGMGNDVNEGNQPPHLDYLRSQCSTTTNLINSLFTTNVVFKENYSGVINSSFELEKFKREFTVDNNDILMLTLNINSANYAYDDTKGQGPYFPGHIFNIIIDSANGKAYHVQSFLSNYTVRCEIFDNLDDIQQIIQKYYDIFVNPDGMKFRTEFYQDNLMQKWNDITYTNVYGYPRNPDIIGECRPKSVFYEIKKYDKKEIFEKFCKNTILFNNMYKVIVNSPNVGENLNNMRNSVGSDLEDNVVETFSKFTSWKFNSFIMNHKLNDVILKSVCYLTENDIIQLYNKTPPHTYDSVKLDLYDRFSKNNAPVMFIKHKFFKIFDMLSVVPDGNFIMFDDGKEIILLRRKYTYQRDLILQRERIVLNQLQAVEQSFKYSDHVNDISQLKFLTRIKIY
jgi:hypothetical protein